VSETPGYGDVVHSLRVRLAGSPQLRFQPADDIAHDLMTNGYLSTEPDPTLVRIALQELQDEAPWEMSARRHEKEGAGPMGEAREQKVAEVVQKYRDLGSGPADGVRVSLPGAPDALPVYAGGARAFTPAAAAMLSELWELTETSEGQQILIEAYKRWQEQDENEARM
jgi:hypothetical protein